MKKRFLSILVTAAMLLSLLPMAAFAEGDAFAEITTEEGTVQYSDTTEFFTAFQTIEVGTVKLLSDFAVGAQHIPVGESQKIILDFNGYKLTKNSSDAVIKNNGELLLVDTGVEGGIDAVSHCVKNYGTLTIDGGVYTTTQINASTAILNDNAILTVNDCTVKASFYALASTGGKVTINNGTFISTSCNHEGNFAYAVSSQGGEFLMENGLIRGVQGGLAVSKGTAIINDGTFETVACTGEADNCKNGGTAYYALYVAGERGNAIAEINGGKYTAVSKAAISVGNDNTNGDGGINADATVVIKGGEFNGGGDHALLTGPVTGTPCIEGGTFNSTKVSQQGETATVLTELTDYLAEGYVISPSGDKFAVAELGEENSQAKIGSKYYATLAEAVSAAQSGDTVTLLRNTSITAAISIPANKDITLDLGGYTLSRDGNMLLDIYGGLTVKNGSIVMTSATNKCAIWANGSARLLVEGDTTVCALENSFCIGFYRDCTNAQVTVKGKLTGGNGLTVNGMITENNNSVKLENAEVSVSEYAVYLAGYADTLISGDSKISGKTGVEIRAGKLQVTGGIITSDAARVDNAATINGGPGAYTGAIVAVKPASATATGYCGDIEVKIAGGNFVNTRGDVLTVVHEANTGYTEAQNVAVMISDGTFNGNFNIGPTVNDTNHSIFGIYGTDTLDISDGYFTIDPSAYLTEGKGLIASDKTGYPYKVGEKAVDVKTAVAAGEPKAAVPDGSDLNADSVKQAAQKEETKATLAAAAVGAGLVNDKGVVGTEVEAKAKLSEANVSVDSATVTVVVQPYLDINVTEVKTTGEEKTVKAEIQAKYNVVATTKPDDIKLNDDKNAVVLKKAQPMTVTQPVSITMPLPAGFAAISDKVYVRHEAKSGRIHLYQTTLTEESGTILASFTNPHGFSEFTIIKDALADNVEVNLVGPNGDSAADYGSDWIGEDMFVPTSDLSGWTYRGWDITAKKDGDTVTLAGGTKVMTEALYREMAKYKADGYTITLDSKTPGLRGSSSGGGSSSKTYAVTVEKSKNGSVTASSKNAASGRTVTLTVKPDEGYMLNELTVTDAKGKDVKLTKKSAASYTFTMPSYAVTVEAVFEKGESERPVDDFRDVSESAWYYEAVDSVVSSGMMSGTSATTFAPNATLTRAMVVQTLWAAQDKPVVNYAMGFKDVAGSDWYAEAIRWAVSEQIVSGYSAEKFGPNDPVTREQLMTILYAYAKSEGKGFTGAWMMQLGYADKARISDWAYEAACWCTTNGVVSGKTGNLLDPQGTATRAEAAQMLVNFMKALEG